MLAEQLCVGRPCLDSPPEEGFGFSIGARALSTPADELLERVRAVWLVVAGWGRWTDDELGDWRPTGELVAQLPEWFRAKLAEQPPWELENWMEGLYDREWTFAGAGPCDSGARFDLAAEAAPISSWPLRFVIELAGGVVVYNDVWRDADTLASRMT